MANVREQLTQPESGMKRISCINSNFKYNNDWSIGSEDGISDIQTLTQNSKVTVYLYTSKVYLLTEMVANRGALNIYINDILKSNISLDNGGTSYSHNIVAYVEEFAEKQIIKLEFENSISNKWVVIENIDIDEDGYMVYCDDNNKLYYDVTPIMTSNTTPDGYKVSASSSYISNIEYKAFDGIIIRYADGNDGWVTSNNIYNGWLNLKSDNKIFMNSFIIYTRYNIPLQAPKNFKILGSNDGENYEIIQEYNNITDWVGYKIFNLNRTYSYKNYKIVVDNTNIAVGIGELRYLLAVDTPFYIIKDNGVYKNYDEENNSLIEIPDISILVNDAVNNTCIYDLNKVSPLIDLNKQGVTIFCNKNKKHKIYGIKTDKEMLISRQNLSLLSAEKINAFKQIISKENNGNCKTVFSIDNGVTWKSYDVSTSQFIDLTNALPLDLVATTKPDNLSEENKTKWNNLQNEIAEKGIDANTMQTLDFATLLGDTYKNIRFAHVIIRPTYDDKVTLQNMSWNIDEEGDYVQTNDVEIAVNSNRLTATSTKENLQNIKVNLLI